jgi:hypothetical protein
MDVLLLSLAVGTRELPQEIGSDAVRWRLLFLVWIGIDPSHEVGDCFSALGHGGWATKHMAGFRPIFFFQDPINPDREAVAKIDGRSVEWIRRGDFAKVHKVARGSDKEGLFTDHGPRLDRYHPQAKRQGDHARGDHIRSDVWPWSHAPLLFITL